jgi:hypothetical protein
VFELTRSTPSPVPSDSTRDPFDARPPPTPRSQVTPVNALEEASMPRLSNTMHRGSSQAMSWRAKAAAPTATQPGISNIRASFGTCIAVVVGKSVVQAGETVCNEALPLGTVGQRRVVHGHTIG